MRTALASRQTPSPQSQPVNGGSIPAPVGGWNAQSPLAAMPITDAATLDNWIPRPGYVECRRGYVAHSTGLPGTVKSLLVWRGGAQDTDKIFGASNTAIYDVTSSGAVGAAVVSGLSTAIWQHTNFANTAGNYMIAVSGGDTPRKYDGSSWSTTSITGSSGSLTLTSSTLSDVMTHVRRLFFIEKNTLRVWFLGTDAISGAATLLDLGPQASLGGVLVGFASWTHDGGNGPDDYAVFLTNNGQAIMYRGTDPTDADNWSLVGVFSLGKPLGQRAIMSYGAELVILTASGVIPMSQALQLDRAMDSNVALTQKIQNEFATSTRLYHNNFGWQAVLYPLGQLAIYNIPITDLGVSYQYVQNVQTGAWCRFKGLNAICWAVANDTPYFGGNTKVYEWDTGGADLGTTITYDVRTAYTGFGDPHRTKQFTMLRPILKAPRTVVPGVDVVCDYKDAIPANTPTISDTGSSMRWGSMVWGDMVWAESSKLRLDWTTVTGVGYVGAARLRIQALPTVLQDGTYPEIKCQLIGFDVMYEVGSVL